MKKRIEHKLELQKSEYLKFLKWLNKRNAYILYPERIICSRYYDTFDYKMFKDTLEGIQPRKKLRIRTYGSYIFEDSKEKYNLEIKSSIDNDRFKEIKEDIVFPNETNVFYLKGYGLCYQKIDIAYNREYFLIDGIRLTIDTNINYFFKDIIQTIQKEKIIDDTYVVEIKASANTDTDFLLNNFNFTRTRFSKYERGINRYLQNQDC